MPGRHAQRMTDGCGCPTGRSAATRTDIGFRPTWRFRAHARTPGLELAGDITLAASKYL